MGGMIPAHFRCDGLVCGICKARPALVIHTRMEFLLARMNRKGVANNIHQ